ncbi:MAG: hypothetical protein QOJ00_1326 [Actinomycetota bacterium]
MTAIADANRTRLQRLWRGPGDDPAWARPALIGLLASTAALYLIGLSASGYANDFYSAAVQAGTHSLKAAFFGASDAAGSITVDKSPLFLWPMEIAARIFGVNSWSVLAPQALEGVAAVGVLYAAVKRWSGAAAGLVAGAVLALTPVATLMFRFNNPDAMLVLLLTCAGYAMVRALEDGRTRWVVGCFALVGLGFLAKMLQAFLVVPPLGVAYLLAGPPRLGTRIRQLSLGAVALFVAAGWWVAAVELTPKSMRPYVGGSQNNSVLNLVFGYNGFGRLTGNERGSVIGGRQAANPGSMWGPTGLLRMFKAQFGGEASWLIPAALVLGAAVLVATIRRDRTDRTRSALLIWGGWLVVTALTFSFGKGIIHAYYTVALAPGIGGTIGVAGAYLWRHRDAVWCRLSLAVATIVTAGWAAVLLHRTPHWNPWLAPFIVVTGTGVALFLLAGYAFGTRALAGAVITAACVGLVGPAAYSLTTARTPHTGAIPSAGPRRDTGLTGPGAPGGARRFGRPRAGRFAAPPVGKAGRPPLGNFGGFVPPARFAAGAGGPPSGLGGGLLRGSKPTKQLTAYLRRDAAHYSWVAATIGANEAAGYQLATDKSVMPVGGFNGTDPSPTLANFERLVDAHKIHFFISSGRGIGGFGSLQANGGAPDNARAIRTWVTSNFSSRVFGGVTVYDLSQPQRASNVQSA